MSIAFVGQNILLKTTEI